MASDPLVREIILDRVRKGGPFEGDTIAEIRQQAELGDFTNKQVRRAIESLHYGYGEVGLDRPRVDEFNRGWRVVGR